MSEAHDASRREVAVWQSAADLLALSNNKFNFQFAKSVIGKNGQLSYNIIWQSKNLAPRFGVSWEPIYALNWTLTLPMPGFTVTLGGVWQTCALGQSYDLSSIGLWTQSSGTTPRPNYMNIGKNNYSYSGQNGIHIVIGVRNSVGGYDVIYVDPTELGLNMSSWYQPQEQVMWWYQTGVRSATMIAGADTPTQVFDMSSPNPETGLFYISTTYIYATGQWINSPNAPPTILETGVLGTPQPSVESGGSPGSNTTAPGKQPAVENGDLQNKIITVEKALLRLTALLSTGGAHVLLAPYAGTIIWPGLTTRQAMEHGGTLAANVLSQRGYLASSWVDMQTMRTGVDFFEVGSPPPPGVPMRVEMDWEDAFAAVLPNIGQTDGGVRDVGRQALQSDKAQNGAGAKDADAQKGDALQLRKAHARTVAAGVANGA